MAKLTVHNALTQVPVITTSKPARANVRYRGICDGGAMLADDGSKYWVKSPPREGVANEILGNLIGKLLKLPVPDVAVVRDDSIDKPFKVASKMESGWKAVAQYPSEGELLHIKLQDMWEVTSLTTLLNCDDCHMGNYIAKSDGSLRKIDMQFLSPWDGMSPDLTGDNPFYFWRSQCTKPAPEGITAATVARRVGYDLGMKLAQADEIVRFAADFHFPGCQIDFIRRFNNRFLSVADRYA